MIPPIWVSFGLAWLVVLPSFVTRMVVRLGMVRQNFKGDQIPTGFGLVILFWSAPALAICRRYLPSHGRNYTMILALAVGFGLLGFVDDRWGDRSVGGLTGHLRRTLLERRMTTGFVKMAGGAIIAFAVPYFALRHNWATSLLDGALIALSANAFNLLDLRPGRSGAIFLIAAIAVALAGSHPGSAPPPIVFVLIPASVAYGYDARAKVMLGDTGSNLLGATLGGSIVLVSPGVWVEGVLVALLLTLHVVAERWSISRIIEATPWLRRLDGLTGVR